MPKDYSKLTDEQMEKESLTLNEKRMEAKAEMKAIAEELDKRAAARRLALMSDAEKDTLRQALGPEGIESEEVVGEPRE